MSSNCHTSNPTGSFVVDPNATNNAKGNLQVTITLPTDLPQYKGSGTASTSLTGRVVTAIITLEATTVTSSQINVEVPGYCVDPAGSYDLEVELKVFELDASNACVATRKGKTPMASKLDTK